MARKKTEWTTADVCRTRKCDRSTVSRAVDRTGISGRLIGRARVFSRDEYIALCRAIPAKRGRPKKGRDK